VYSLRQNNSHNSAGRRYVRDTTATNTLVLEEVLPKPVASQGFGGEGAELDWRLCALISPKILQSVIAAVAI